jgi:nitroreductase
MELDKAIQNRHSVRKFDSKKPDWRTIIECIDSARYAPMAGNNYTLKFILVSDVKKLKEIAEASQQRHVGEAQYIVIVCSNPSRPVNAFGKGGEIFCRQQAGAAIQNFLLKIEESGLATCWVGSFGEEQIKRALDIPDDINIEAIFPVGYEYGKRDSKKKRFSKIELDRILYFNEYGNVKMKNPRTVD